MPWEKGSRHNAVPTEQLDAIAEARRAGMSYLALQEHFGASSYTVHHALQRAGLIVRQQRPKKSAEPAKPKPFDPMAGHMPDWMLDGACAQVGPSWFFPGEDENGRGNPGMSYNKGRAICAECPVRAECLQYALDIHEPHGMWGGTTPAERERMLIALRTTDSVAS